jgi:hypothetical protein
VGAPWSGVDGRRENILGDGKGVEKAAGSESGGYKNVHEFQGFTE